ncbi:MAG: glycosyltransferase family 9 protein [Bacteroidota bacterium]|nr:glycosyltransferase family 9 protein [Bacteroidota bacterium]
MKIDFLCENFAADVVRGNPFLRNVLTFNKKQDATLSIISRIRKNKYDIVIDLFGNPRTAIITRWSGANIRIGFPFRGRAYAYTDLVPPRGGEVHNVEFNLDVLKHFNFQINSTSPLFPLSDAEKIFADNFFIKNKLSGKTVIGINASGGWYTKKWNVNSFANLINRIYAGGNFEFVLFWGPGEYDDAVTIQKNVKVTTYLIPKTTLKEMGALLERCSYLISNDSGPMHIAASLKVPTLGIFGPTNPHLQGPYGEHHVWVRNEQLDCLECNLTKCPIGNVCMTELSVGVVYSAFQHLIKKNKK